MKFKLAKPLVINDKEISELDLELEKLSGKDVLSIEQEVGNDAGLQSIYAHFAARAARIPVDDLKTLTANDFMRLTGTVASFFRTQDSLLDGSEKKPATDAATATTNPVKNEKV